MKLYIAGVHHETLVNSDVQPGQLDESELKQAKTLPLLFLSDFYACAIDEAYFLSNKVNKMNICHPCRQL